MYIFIIFSTYRYRIQLGSFDDIAIDNETGLVSVERKLDYDRHDNYRIEVVASDLGKRIISHTYTHTYLQNKKYFRI